MSLNSHWFSNGQPSKLEEQKNPSVSKKCPETFSPNFYFICVKRKEVMIVVCFLLFFHTLFSCSVPSRVRVKKAYLKAFLSLLF